jgi:hypothetical protein
MRTHARNMSSNHPGRIGKFELQIASDLHIERHLVSGAKCFMSMIRPAAQNLALVGDIGVVADSRCFSVLKEFLSTASRAFGHVYFLCGNHEYYTVPWDVATPEMVHHRIEEFSSTLPNLTFLHRKSVCPMKGIRLIGATLWSDIPLSHQPFLNEHLNDYHRIVTCTNAGVGEGWDTLLPRESIVWHHRDRTFIEQELASADASGERSIVLTHHAPLLSGTADPKYEKTDEFGERQPMNYAFASDCSAFFQQPSLRAGVWVFGHTHFNVDRFLKSGTRLVANQVGYESEPFVQSSYRTNFVIEL